MSTRRCVAVSMLVGLTLCAGCLPRKWYITAENRPTTKIPGVVSVSFDFLKQRNSYVHAILTIANEGQAPLRFAPIDENTTAWGIDLEPHFEPPPQVRRLTPVTEAGLIIVPGKTGTVEVQWQIRPKASSNKWPWSITIDGLVAGDERIERVTIPMPPFTRRPRSDR